jgi:hypothetical protein
MLIYWDRGQPGRTKFKANKAIKPTSPDVLDILIAEEEDDSSA